MDKRRVGPFSVSALGLGCMNLSHAYGAAPPPDVAERVLLTALDHGVDFFDTAPLYGFGANEELLGRALKPHRQTFVLASKCGIFKNAEGKRHVDGSPATLKKTCEDSLRRLQTDVIDLYYLHRLDKRVPIEDSVGAMADLVREGKVRALGLSEMSAATLRRAHAVHPIAAMQSEYSLWTRNPEIAVLDACRELGVGFVAFSPLARAYLCGTLHDPSTELEAGDIRRGMPRFNQENYAKNRALLDGYAAIAREVGCTMPQLALAWLLAKDPSVVPIPGTRKPDYVVENLGAAPIKLSADVVSRLDALINERTVVGARYNDVAQAEIDTEDFQ
jgi:aryl-alcohol dehydrogenase-like predicted oxidoreductase